MGYAEDRVKADLVSKGYIVRKLSTASGEDPEPDFEAERGGHRILVEAKGVSSDRPPMTDVEIRQLRRLRQYGEQGLDAYLAFVTKGTGAIDYFKWVRLE